jgi:hypothetical protein
MSGKDELDGEDECERDRWQERGLQQGKREVSWKAFGTMAVEKAVVRWPDKFGIEGAIKVCFKFCEQRLCCRSFLKRLKNRVCELG